MPLAIMTSWFLADVTKDIPTLSTKTWNVWTVDNIIPCVLITASINFLILKPWPYMHSKKKSIS